MIKGTTTYVLIVSIVIAAHFLFRKSIDTKNFDYGDNSVNITSLAPSSIQTYEYFLAASNKYHVPKYIVMGILKLETTFTHPLDFKYNPHRISSAKAYGPAQVQLATAKWVMQDNSITKEDLLYNIALNAEISMKYVRMLYDRYKNWNTALGFYNSGYPITNSYAVNITKNSY